MEIEILTHGKARKELLKSIAEFFAQELNITKSKNKVVIVTDPTLKSDGSNGLCARTGKREITVALYSYLDHTKMLYTLAHEMVHVKQMCRGHYKSVPMKYGKGVYHFWLGKRVNTEYIKRPWEIEAFSKESLLVEKLVSHVEKLHKKGNKKA